jgi:hypothetical protein
MTLLAIIILFAAATIILTLRNFAIATMSFGVDACVPLVQFAIVYVRGVTTGCGLFAPLGRSYGASRRRVASGHHRRVKLQSAA